MSRDIVPTRVGTSFHVSSIRGAGDAARIQHEFSDQLPVPGDGLPQHVHEGQDEIIRRWRSVDSVVPVG
jgi:hypothetical protein